MSDIEVMIADNQPLTISGLRSAVADQEDIRVLAECQNSDRLMDTVRNCAPDVLLVSTDMLKEELDEIEHLVAEIENTRVILLTNRKDVDFLEGALRRGAKGVFQRDWPIHQIPIAIRKVTNGGVWLEQAVAERVLEEVLSRRKSTDPDEAKIASLTAPRA